MDDGGRRAAGFKRKNTGDCCCRAVAIATRQNYLDVHRALAIGCKSERNVKRTPASPENGIRVQRWWFIRYMADLGFFYTHIPRPWPVLGEPGLPKGRILIESKDHICAVINGVVHDTADRRGFHTQRIYGYWRQCKFPASVVRKFLDNLNNSVILKA